jgi:hypothetical protein
LSKFRGLAGRIALVLHRVEAAVEGKEPEQPIGVATLQKALDWSRWLLDQNLYLYQSLGLADDPELSRILRFVERFKETEWVKADDLRRWWSPKPKPSANEARKFLARVVELELAISNGDEPDSASYRISISKKRGRSGRETA